MKKILKVFLIVVMLIITLYGFNNTAVFSSEEDLSRIEETIRRLSLKCYSIEGRYPQDIQYLKDNYGLLLNDDDYQVIYYYQADNLEPYVKVWKKGA